MLFCENELSSRNQLLKKSTERIAIMSNIAAAQPVPQTNAEYEAEFERIMAEANDINEQMRRDQAGTEQLELETKAIKKDIVRLKSETRAILVGMGAQL